MRGKRVRTSSLCRVQPHLKCNILLDSEKDILILKHLQKIWSDLPWQQRNRIWGILCVTVYQQKAPAHVLILDEIKKWGKSLAQYIVGSFFSFGADSVRPLTLKQFYMCFMWLFLWSFLIIWFFFSKVDIFVSSCDYQELQEDPPMNFTSWNSHPYAVPYDLYNQYDIVEITARGI